MDFDLASKHKKEVEQRRREAKRKLEQQRKDENLQAAMERDFRQREEERLKQAEAERQRAQQEALLNDGVYYRARLRPYPSTRTDDKLELPASALQDLEKQGALDSGSLLTFSVNLPHGGPAPAPGEEGAALPATHAGVAEFTAEEGTVGVPPRVALCLTKGTGLGSLAAVMQVEVRYARLPRSRKSRVVFQPRGQGFHIGGASAFRIDLEHVLQESLRGHTALSEGDWLPIRHEGVTYELVVKTLEPEPQLALLDTDLTVEVLPSEQTEAELRAEEERRLREEEAAREAQERESQRLEAARLKAMALGPEPEPGPEVVQLLLRLPDGGRLSRRFARDDRLQRILDWVESEPSSRVRDGEFRVVQKWPGHCRELGAAEAGETLGALKFARQEALFLQHLADEAMPDATAATEEAAPVATSEPPEGSLAAAAWAAGARPAPPQLDGQGAGDWSAAEERAHQVLDARLGRVESPTAALLEGSLEEVKGSELVGVFERLVALGMSPEPAAVTAKKFGAQLRELGEMGFEDWLEAVTLLERYNGRVLRVANLLSERAAEGAPAELPPAPAAVAAPAPAAASPPAPAPATTAPRATALNKEVVAAKFRELVAEGMAPNDAATRAIQLVREEMRSGEAAAAQPAAPAPAAAVPEAQAAPSFEDKLPDLAAMGFTDEDKNRALLRKYAGRVDRVVDALCSG